MTMQRMLRRLISKFWVPFEGLGTCLFWWMDEVGRNGTVMDQFGMPVPIIRNDEPLRPLPPQPPPTLWERRYGGLLLAGLATFVIAVLTARCL